MTENIGRGARYYYFLLGLAGFGIGIRVALVGFLDALPFLSYWILGIVTGCLIQK